MNIKEADEMVKKSKEEGLHLMVGHLLQYHPVFKKLKEMNIIPDADLCFWERKKLERNSVHSLFEGKDILLVSVCGAFTPPCTEMVKEYEAMYDKFIKDTIVDDIYIVSMNDSFVMDKWFKSMKIKKCSVCKNSDSLIKPRRGLAHPSLRI